MDDPSESVFVAMRDGTRLATDVYLPDHPGGIPAVLARTPYGKRANPVWFGAIGRLFAASGMAFVAQDTRGRYESDGAAAPFVSETADAVDTIDWIVRQPWSDGTLAVFGESYVGFTALAAAASQHPAIRAAVLRNTASDIADDWLRHQGVPRLEFVLRWALAAWSGKESLAPELDWTIRPLRNVVPSVDPDRVPAVLDAWASGDGPRRFWRGDAGWPSLIDQLRVPTHLTTGWWDLFVRGAVRDWTRHLSHARVDSRLAVEATDHAGHDWGDGPTPDPLADFDALGARMPSILANELAFLRRHLVGPALAPPVLPVTWTLTHVGEQSSESWPPRTAEPLRLHLVDGGRAHHGPEGGGLSERADHVPVMVRWRHDPRDLVPALEGEAVAGWFRRPDERTTQVRDDVVTFSSDAVREAIDLAGPVVADLAIKAGATGGHVMAKLCDIQPTGEARRIADGTSVVPPGWGGGIVSVDLGHTGYRLRPDHRLRLELASSAFPRYIWHPGTREDPWVAVRTRAVEFTLQTGSNESGLRLTVLRDRTKG